MKSHRPHAGPESLITPQGRRGGFELSRRQALVLSAATLLSGAGTGARAAGWPERAVRIVVPFAAGGPSDIVARLLAPKMMIVLGQPVIVDNRPGAGGVTGVDVAAKAAPDGYTIALGSAGGVGRAARGGELHQHPFAHGAYAAREHLCAFNQAWGRPRGANCSRIASTTPRSSSANKVSNAFCRAIEGAGPLPVMGRSKLIPYQTSCPG